MKARPDLRQTGEVDQRGEDIDELRKRQSLGANGGLDP